MKTPSKDLFDLIKSINSNEKAIFKVYYKQNTTEQKYIKLFDAIDSMEIYDENKIALFSFKSVDRNKNYELKKYLKEALLKFLEYYFSDSSIEIQLQRQLQRIEVLFAKGLFPSTKKIIEKALLDAEVNCKYNYQLILLNWKRKITLQEANYDNLNSYKKKNIKSC